MRRLVSVLLILVAVIMCGEVLADAKADARKHFESGVALRKVEDYAGAAVEFEESVRIYKTKAALFNLANCYKAMHRYAEALAALKLLQGEFGDVLNAEMRAAVASLEKEIETVTGTLAVKVDRAGASIFVDDGLVGKSPLPSPLLLGPGYHEIRVELNGMETARRKAKLVSGAKLKLDVKLKPQDGPESLAETEGPENPVTHDSEGTSEEGGGSVPLGEAPADRGPLLLGLGTTGTALTVAAGIIAGIFWSKAASSKADYNAALEDFADAEGDIASQQMLHGDLEKYRDDTEANNSIAVGFTVGAGVLAAASAVVWVIYARNRNEDDGNAEVDVAASPGGVAVSF